MPDPSVRKVFRATIEKDDEGGVFITMPFNVEQVFGTRARLPVRGTINGCPFRSSISPYGGVHYLPVNKALRAAAGVQPGETIEIAIEWDDAPREIVPPADLAHAMASEDGAQAAWEKLSYTRRKECALAVETARRPETRLRRIEQIVAELTAKS